MKHEIVVVGAGMVGTCTALELTLRGHRVILVDRRAPGSETSYGNAGVIQREAVEPYAFPRDWPTLATAMLGRRMDIRYHLSGVLAAWPALLRYWWHSAPHRHRVISRDYETLIRHSVDEHRRFIDQAKAEPLVRRDGLRLVYRSEQALNESLVKAHGLKSEYGVNFDSLDAAALAVVEPDFVGALAGAIHWTDAWSISQPGELVRRYGDLFVRLGGSFLNSDVSRLLPTATGWKIETADGMVHAEHAVIALGPWACETTRTLGYRLPLFVKRGYHLHYRGGGTVAVPTVDAERGYVLSPQELGLRLTTGAELAAIDAKPTPVQIALAEAEARTLLDLGTAVEAAPWMGSRPCCADMKPVVGPAYRHRRLWFNFGHGHQGFTLGPACARLLADQIEGKTPYVSAKPFLPERFMP
ncbi:NAD(P)/FAD-dependent oxidoreductase [Roseateles sp. NT4]|uniref:NAD(P)/FAD-dependent oxidoreductase n=1 Tax=Roseateles sp. NT4 TaxID=3453715 RepID=UPI003EEFDF7F